MRGHLLITKDVPHKTRDIADEANLELQVVQEAMAKFEAMDMLHREGDVWVVTNFKKRQYDKKSDWPENTRARKRAQREREKQGRCAADADVSAAAASAGITKEVTAAEGNIIVTPAGTPVFAPVEGLTETTGGYPDSTLAVTLLSRQGHTTKNAGSHAGSHSTVTRVSRGSHGPDTRKYEEARGQQNGFTADESLPPTNGVYAFPAKNPESPAAPRSYAGVTPRSRESHTPYASTGNSISDKHNKYIHAGDDKKYLPLIVVYPSAFIFNSLLHNI